MCFPQRWYTIDPIARDAAAAIAIKTHDRVNLFVSVDGPPFEHVDASLVSADDLPVRGVGEGVAGVALGEPWSMALELESRRRLALDELWSALAMAPGGTLARPVSA